MMARGTLESEIITPAMSYATVFGVVNRYEAIEAVASVVLCAHTSTKNILSHSN